MKSLVTGGAGFIGSHLVDALLARGHEVVVLDNFMTGRRANLAHCLDRVELIEGDIRDEEACGRACRGADWVFHQAALGSVPRSMKEPLLSHEINTGGTLKMLSAARDAEVSAFVFAASSSYFGDTEELPKHDQMPARPLSPYAVTKACCEQYISVFAGVYGLPAVGLRYFNIFGPRQDPQGPYAAVIPKFLEALLAGRAPTIHGDGEQTRDFTYVENAIAANLAAAESAGEVAGEVMNVACGERISLNMLYEGLRDALGVSIDAVHGPPRAGDIRDSLADVSKARRLIGYEPRVGVEEGLRRTVEAWQAERA